MIALIQFNVVLLAVALSIGVITGWWMFGRRATPGKTEDEEQT
jgi:hypothetical protein